MIRDLLEVTWHVGVVAFAWQWPGRGRSALVAVATFGLVYHVGVRHLLGRIPLRVC